MALRPLPLIQTQTARHVPVEGQISYMSLSSLLSFTFLMAKWQIIVRDLKLCPDADKHTWNAIVIPLGLYSGTLSLFVTCDGDGGFDKNVFIWDRAYLYNLCTDMLDTELVIVMLSIAMGRFSQYILATYDNNCYVAELLQPPLPLL